MKYKFSELINIDKIQVLTDSFCEAVGIASAIIDLKGTVLIGSRWQKICTDFHRVNPETCLRCIESDTILANQLLKEEKYAIYKCRNGLIDAAAPIVIEGEHIANFFVGQFLFEPPDAEYFRNQAREYGFDETSYLETLSQVPIIPKKRIEPILDFLSGFAEVLGEMGLKQIRQLESTNTLRESEKRFKDVSFSIADWIWEVDDNSVYTYCSEKIEELLGYSVNEMVGKTPFDFMAPDEAEKIEVTFKETLEQKDSINDLENWKITKDGRKICLLTNGVPILDENGNMIGYRGVDKNITERKRAEEALQESRRSLSTLMSNLPGIAYRCRNDRDRTMEFLSDGCIDLTGYSPSDLIHNNKISCAQLIQPDDREVVWKNINTALKKKQAFRMVYRILTAAGEKKWVWEQGRGVFSPKGELLALEGFITDITEQKKADEALKKSSKKTKLFAYSVSHDLKGPAIGIHGLTKLLHKQYGKILDEKGKSYCDQILKASERIAELVEKINIYIATKEAPLTIEQVKLTEVFRMIREDFSPQLNIRQIKWSEPENMPVINGDRVSILRIIRNLVDNSLKYGGDDLSEIKIGYKESDAFHVLSVKDDGVGIGKEDSKKIFGAFKRHETSRGIEGTGLGLAIVKEIAERHNGTVWAEPGAKKGITFYVSISKFLRLFT